MIELTLVGAIAFLSGLLAWEKHNNRKEQSKLINAVLAKDNTEMLNLELADKTKIEPQKNEETDFVPTSTIGDEEYEKFIKNSIK